MDIINFPKLNRKAPTSGTFALIANTQVFESPFNRTTQTAELPGARWKASFRFDNLEESDVRLIQAFLAQLRGAAGRFYLWNMTHKKPAGTALGDPRVAGGGQSGRVVTSKGWAPSQEKLLLPGDFISINGELKIITAQIASDAAGNATMKFEPPLRNIYSQDNALIVTDKPNCIMRLPDDEQDSLNLEESRIANFKLDCVEVFS
ncbi:MAG: hypothetical protein FWD70_07350 [Desulfuromonadales bacterium]|nr:hypothetical protein [Desulfuromonadales bacterium]